MRGRFARWGGQEWVLWGWVALGASLRVAQYAADRSLWIDESFLALNIIRRPFSGMFLPLDLNQAAPPLFLAALWGATHAVASSSLVLRLAPLVGGLASLELFRRIVRRRLDFPAACFAMAAFALSDHLIYFASEVKPYSTDVTAALACYALSSWVIERPESRRRVAAAAAAGSLLIWFSYPAIFILAGLISAWLWRGATAAGGGARRPYALAAAACSLGWAASFVLFWAFHLRRIGSDSYLRGYWDFAFPPRAASPAALAAWFDSAMRGLIDGAFEPWDALPALAMLALGAAATLRKPEWLLTLAVPWAAALAASALRRYPFNGRLILFLVPSVYLIIAEYLMAFRTHRVYPLVCLGAAAMLFGGEAVSDACFVARPRARSELRPLIERLRRDYRDGDTVALSWYANLVFEAETPGLASRPYRRVVLPRSEGGGGAFVAALEGLAGERRVWWLWGGVADWRAEDVISEYVPERAEARATLEGLGRRVSSVESKGALLDLYDLSGSAAR